MISKEVAASIWNCYNEIDQAKKMIEVMKESINEKGELELKDGWNESRNSLQLHIPTGSASYHIKRVSANVALVVIQEHIKSQEIELERLKHICKIQLA